MKKVVVDSDIIIDWLRMGQGRWLELAEQMAEGKIDIYCSSVTVLELFAGESAKLQEKLILEIIGKLKVVALDGQLARLVGETKRALRTQVALGDLVVGMTAVWLKAKLATKNQKHFAQIEGLKFFEA